MDTLCLCCHLHSSDWPPLSNLGTKNLWHHQGRWDVLWLKMLALTLLTFLVCLFAMYNTQTNCSRASGPTSLHHSDGYEESLRAPSCEHLIWHRSRESVMLVEGHAESSSLNVWEKMNWTIWVNRSDWRQLAINLWTTWWVEMKVLS